MTKLEGAKQLLLEYAAPLMERLIKEGMTSDEAVAQVLKGLWAKENVHRDRLALVTMPSGTMAVRLSQDDPVPEGTIYLTALSEPIYEKRVPRKPR